MYGLIYRIYFILKRKQKKKKEKNKETGFIIQKLLDRIEWYYNILIKEKYEKCSIPENILEKKERKERIIISLTSYPKRIGDVWITIETLLRQTVKPDMIILWLADTQFNGIESLPKKLIDLQKSGLTIRFCKDLKSHKKYFYTMQEYPEDLIILVDDDMFYPYDMIEKLLKLHYEYPQDICTMTAQVIGDDITVVPSKWKNPDLSQKYQHSTKLQIFTGSGSLYPPNSLNAQVFNEEVMKELCPYADDLWLTFMAKLNGTKVTTQYPWRAFPITIYGSGIGSLYYINAEEGQNDVQWKALLNYFKVQLGEVEYE